MEYLLNKSQLILNSTKLNFKRYLYRQINWDARLIGIKGARGTGKTTLLLQRLKELKLSSSKAVYFSLDDLYFTGNSLFEIVHQFYQQGGKYLFLDEVHKYKDWSALIKNLYDTYHDLNIVFTGSSIIDISKEEGDLSRRAVMYELNGLSYRKYLIYTGINELPQLSLSELLDTNVLHEKLSLNDFRPLQYFQQYLKLGYYPFFKEDESGYSRKIHQLIRTIVEYDMAELKDFDIRNAKKMLQLLYVISQSVPFKPNMSELARKSGIHRNSIASYLHYLEQARLIRMLYPLGTSTSILQKPEKIFLDNTNFADVLSMGNPDKGNTRETFVLNQLSVNHVVNYTKAGDFVVDDQLIFEVGGKNKNRAQINDFENAYIIKDDIEFSLGKTIPMWMIGLLY